MAKKIETTMKFARCIREIYLLTKNAYVKVDFPSLAKKHQISRSYDSVLKKLGYLEPSKDPSKKHTWKWVKEEPTDADFDKIHIECNLYSRIWTTKKREEKREKRVEKRVESDDVKRLQEELELYKRKSEILAELAKINDNLSKIK